MKVNRLHFSIEIKASKAQIWKALWNDASYRSWADVFYAGSYVVAENWEVGSHVQFLAPDQSGIYSLIEKHIPDDRIQFKHIASVVKGQNQAIDAASKKWTGATEIYKITAGTEFNTLSVEIDVMDEHVDFMTKTFPKALEVIQQNCT